MQTLLEHPLAQLSLAGWTVDWMAVRRRYNEAADKEATQAVLRAAQLKTEGIISPEYSSS